MYGTWTCCLYLYSIGFKGRYSMFKCNVLSDVNVESVDKLLMRNLKGFTRNDVSEKSWLCRSCDVITRRVTSSCTVRAGRMYNAYCWLSHSVWIKLQLNIITTKRKIYLQWLLWEHVEWNGALKRQEWHENMRSVTSSISTQITLLNVWKWSEHLMLFFCCRDSVNEALTELSQLSGSGGTMMSTGLTEVVQWCCLRECVHLILLYFIGSQTDWTEK